MLRKTQADLMEIATRRDRKGLRACWHLEQTKVFAILRCLDNIRVTVGRYCSKRQNGRLGNAVSGFW
ncbi:MAG: hypothetical protein HYX94_09355 [Chloroflexi bacterium]|nr:hypothetical protein [Chloroflexota bacterium]